MGKLGCPCTDFANFLSRDQNMASQPCCNVVGNHLLFIPPIEG